MYTHFVCCNSFSVIISVQFFLQKMKQSLKVFKNKSLIKAIFLVTQNKNKNVWKDTIDSHLNHSLNRFVQKHSIHSGHSTWSLNKIKTLKKTLRLYCFIEFNCLISHGYMYGNLYCIYLWKYAIIIPQTSQFRLCVFRLMNAFCQVNFNGYAVLKE